MSSTIWALTDGGVVQPTDKFVIARSVASGDNRAISGLNLATASAARKKLIKIISTGDSKSAEPTSAMRWADAQSPFDNLVIGWQDLGIGGSTTGNTGGASGGLTDPARLAVFGAAVAAVLASGAQCDCTVQSGTNDFPVAGIIPVQTQANMTVFIQYAIAAGVTNIFLCCNTPRTLTVGTLCSINNAYADLAHEFAGYVFLCDGTPYLLDQSNVAAFQPIGGSANTIGCVTYDGLHLSGMGIYMFQYAMLPAMQRAYGIAPQFSLTPLSPGGDIYATGSPKANIVGIKGRNQAQGGTAGTTSGTELSTPPVNWTSSGSISTNTVLTWSNPTCAALDTYCKQSVTGIAPNNKCVQMDFTGSTAASGAGAFLLQSASSSWTNPGGTTPYWITAVMNYINRSGLFFLSRATSGLTGAPGPGLGTSGTHPSDLLPTLNGLYMLKQYVEDSSAAASTFERYREFWVNGSTQAGTTQFISFGLRMAQVP